MNNQEEIVCHSRQQLRILNKFRKRLDKEKYINNYASNYYGNMHNRFSIPGIIVSGVSSIASFLATSDMMSDTGKTAISIGVGILAAGSTIIYSIANSYGFQSRRDSFQISADAYDDLITRIEFELVNPNENFNEFCNSLESQILKIKTDCKYLPPLFIYKMYEEESRKLKQSGLDEERETSLDFIMVDSSPIRSGIPAIPLQTKQLSSCNNKQIRLPGPSTPNPVSGEGTRNQVTYFNDLALSSIGPMSGGSPSGATMTTVNKLTSVGITIPSLELQHDISDQLEPDQLLTATTTTSIHDHANVSINIVNMDGADMDGTSSI